MAAKPIPEGYNTLSIYLGVDDARQAIDFYKKAFAATERGVMLSDPFEQSRGRSRRSSDPTGSIGSCRATW